jgi:hypothetical protein
MMIDDDVKTTQKNKHWRKSIARVFLGRYTPAASVGPELSSTITHIDRSATDRPLGVAIVESLREILGRFEMAAMKWQRGDDTSG